MQTAYIALGANYLPSWAGRPGVTLRAAVERLGRVGQVTRRSSLYSTEPVGMPEQPRFVNAVVALETYLEPQYLLKELLAIEQNLAATEIRVFPMGRGRSIWIFCW